MKNVYIEKDIPVKLKTAFLFLNLFFKGLFLEFLSLLEQNLTGRQVGWDREGTTSQDSNSGLRKRNCTTFRNAAHKAIDHVLDTFSVEFQEINCFMSLF